MRESAPTPARTFSTSTSSSSQNSAISFMNEIFVASSALAAYFTISALFGDMRWIGEYSAEKQDDLRDDSRTNDPILVRDDAGVYRRTQRTRVNQFRPELLFSYAPMPGTVFYLGYGGQLTDRRALRFNELERVRDQLFVKGSYLWRM